MSTARDFGDDQGFNDHVNQPNGDVNQPAAGTWERPNPAGFGKASEERLLTPVAMDPAATPRYSVTPTAVDRPGVVHREGQQRFGGIKVGSAFLGWMAAVGVAVLLTALLAAAGVVLSVTSATTTTDIDNQAAAATGTARTIGLIGAIVLLLALFVAYFCGGYVAGRMARFDGAKQGLAVWLWGIVFAVLVAILVTVSKNRYHVASDLNLPHIPISPGDVTTAGIVAIAAAVVVTLVAALLGGKAGMHFHREVDKAELTQMAV